MAQHPQDKSIRDAVELLKTNGFDGMADAVTALLNAAMVAERSEHLNAAPYERSENRVGYANGFKGKTVRTRWANCRLAFRRLATAASIHRAWSVACAQSACCCYRLPKCTFREARPAGSRTSLKSSAEWK